MELTEPQGLELERLQHDVRWAVAKGLGPRALVPMLERLVRQAPPGSVAQHEGMLQLAELLIQTAPWRAALLCRRVTKEREWDLAFGLLGLAHTVLGHHRAAVRAYRRALVLRPDAVAYAHNLGHLLDVAFDKPAQGLHLLEAAHRSDPAEPEMAGSYAHALVRLGRPQEALQALRRALATPEAERLLERWNRR
jgi:Tfp pilus assembly protein PilF